MAYHACVAMQWMPERLRQVRMAKGLSHEKLARLIGISRQAVAAWEAGSSEPSGKHLVLLAQVLGKPERYFYGEDVELGEQEGASRPHVSGAGEQKPIPAAAMPEPATPDWDAPPAEGPAPAIEDIMQEIQHLKRRIDDLERGMGGKGKQ